jgi:putative radical SAM enzyme (TIGR03279 family)
MPGLPVEAVRGAAERAGLRAGDEIVAVDGRPAVDVLDLEAAAADDAFALTVRRDGRALALNVDLERGESHGVALAGGLGAPVRRCRNDCRFCFVDQVPVRLRPSLRVKDDDYRLSFLHGTFITLTNMDEDDLARVERLRLSPLFVSLHDWDDERRARLMGEPARASRAKLMGLARAGIELHAQVVLCPGWNDGAALTETIAGLAAVPAVADAGVVPVSLAAEGELRRVTAGDAARAIALVEAGQLQARPSRGKDFAHAADELYLLAGRRPPASDAELQYENGVGLVAATLAEVDQVRLDEAPAGRSGADRRRFALLTGTLGLPVIEEVCARLASRGGEPAEGTRDHAVSPDAARDRTKRANRTARVRPYVVDNELFGPHVTVTGLLGGSDVLRSLRERPLAVGEWLLAPEAFLPPGLGVTLDDVPFKRLREACDGRFAVGRSLAEVFVRAGR